MYELSFCIIHSLEAVKDSGKPSSERSLALITQYVRFIYCHRWNSSVVLSSQKNFKNILVLWIPSWKGCAVCVARHNPIPLDYFRAAHVSSLRSWTWWKNLLDISVDIESAIQGRQIMAIRRALLMGMSFHAARSQLQNQPFKHRWSKLVHFKNRYTLEKVSCDTDILFCTFIGKIYLFSLLTVCVDWKQVSGRKRRYRRDTLPLTSTFIQLITKQNLKIYLYFLVS